MRATSPLIIACASLLLWFVLPNAAFAQDLEPRQYANIPVGLNFLGLGYGSSQGSVLFDPAVALDNASIRTDGPVLGYARSLALGGFSGKFDAGVGRVCMSGAADYEGQRVTRETCGLTDSRMRLSVNFLGSPALRISEFAGYQQKLIVGASISLSMPTGEYDIERLVNIGTNRSAVKAEIGVSRAAGPWILELALADTFFGTNNEFFVDAVRKQDPIVSLQAHFIRNFQSGVWMAIDTTQYDGGATQTNGVRNDNRQSNSRFGLTVSIPVNRRQSVKAYYSTGLSTRTGTEFDVAGALWQYRWGQGI